VKRKLYKNGCISLVISLCFISGFSVVKKAEAAPYFFDTFATNTMGQYTWDTFALGTSNTWVASGYVLMDGIHCCYNMSGATVKKTLDITPNGYANIGFNLVEDGAAQSRIIFELADDNANNSYIYTLTDTFYGSSGWTEGIAKKVNGAIVDQYKGPGSFNPVNGTYDMGVWWSPSSLKLSINGTLVTELITSDQTPINPTSFSLLSYRLTTQLDDIMLLDTGNTVVPLPAPLLLFASGIIGVFGMFAKRKRL